MATYISNEFYENLSENKKYIVEEVVKSEAQQGNLIKFKNESEL